MDTVGHFAAGVGVDELVAFFWPHQSGISHLSALLLSAAKASLISELFQIGINLMLYQILSGPAFFWSLLQYNQCAIKKCITSAEVPQCPSESRVARDVTNQCGENHPVDKA